MAEIDRVMLALRAPHRNQFDVGGKKPTLGEKLSVFHCKVESSVLRKYD